MTEPKGGVRRRDVLKGAGGLAAATAISGFPYVAGAQSNVIRIGLPTILSGRVAILGETTRTAAEMAAKQFNDAGGVNGRTVELIIRDSKGAPDEAARITRDLINTEGAEIILDGEASSGAFAVQEVIRDLPVLAVHTNSETSALTAEDPRADGLPQRAPGHPRRDRRRALRRERRARQGADALDDRVAGLRLRP